MLQPNFSPFPVLTTDRLVLRQITDKDIPVIYFLRSDPGVMKYVRRAPFRAQEEAVQFVQIVTDAATNQTGISWAITLKGNDQMIGIISLWRLIKEHYRAENGYMLHPHYQGKGIMNEAEAVVLDYGFQVLRLHTIEARTNPENKASRKLLERHHFVQEAWFKEYHFFDGKFSDTIVYSKVNPVK